MAEKKKIAIISACIGNAGKTGAIKFTDTALKELEEYGVDIYSFTDDDIDKLLTISQPILSKEQLGLKELCILKQKYYAWKYQQPIYPSAQDNQTRLLAKIPKMLFYKLIPSKYDYYIWLDSKFTIEEHWLDYVLWLINTHDDFDVMVSKHSERNSIKEEVDFMLRYRNIVEWGLPQKYNLASTLCQYELYKNRGFNDNRLYELGFIVYSNSILTKKLFLEEWYAHNVYFTIQDQVSFPFLTQKYQLKPINIIQNVFEMPFAKHE